MTRIEKLKHEARQRRLAGKSKLKISMAAHGLIELPEEELGKLKTKRNDKALDRMMNRLGNIEEGSAYIPSSKEEDLNDWRDHFEKT